eukprot:gene6023-7672_t
MVLATRGFRVSIKAMSILETTKTIKYMAVGHINAQVETLVILNMVREMVSEPTHFQMVSYQGKYKEDKRDSYGIATYPDGSKYTAWQ